jgi:hypothetical protein
MLNFRVKIDPAIAYDSYSAWREADHDDRILSVALAAWWDEQNPEFRPCAPVSQDAVFQLNSGAAMRIRSNVPMGYNIASRAW